MRAVYKNPKELATCLKDLIDLYLDDLMTYEKLTVKILKIVDANEVETDLWKIKYLMFLESKEEK